MAKILPALIWASAPLVIGLGACAAVAADDGHLANGRRLAERDCGGCHAVGPRGQSANADAPPFRELGRRYDVGGLASALRGGMLVGHPRMPMISLGEDEIADLTAYVKRIQATTI